ncbi:hypothetical protein FBQ85_30115 [Cytophagia bacterium CHB2]|nr:hypothetical protein [Cytophagia bacterium CHB2]
MPAEKFGIKIHNTSRRRSVLSREYTPMNANKKLRLWGQLAVCIFLLLLRYDLELALLLSDFVIICAWLRDTTLTAFESSD